MIRRILLSTVRQPNLGLSGYSRLRIARHFADTVGQATENKASSFKSKNFMKEFIKYVHPDILHQAPERVREENSRSMQSLNSYLDQLKRNEGSNSIEVRFYTPEKTTRKNKKFFFFSARLEAFKPKLDGESLDALKNRLAALILRISQSLLNSVHQVLGTHLGLKDEDNKAAKKDKSAVPKGFTDMNEATFESAPGLFKKNSAKRQEYLTQMNSIHQAYKQYLKGFEKQELIESITESITLIDPANKQKKAYAQHLAENLEFMKNKDVLLSNLFDPRLIMLDQVWAHPVAKNIDKSPFKKECAPELIKVFKILRENYPSMYIILSNRYSTDVPGFICFKWDDDLKTITSYLSEKIDVALDSILNYQYDVRKLLTFSKEIKAEFALHQLEVDFRSADLQSEGAFLLNLRTCLREVLAEDAQLKTALSQSSFTLSNEQRLQKYSYSLVWNFNRDELKGFLLSAHSNIQAGRA